MNAQTEERLFDLTRDDDQRMNQDTMQRFATHEIRAVAKEADEAGTTPEGFYSKTAELGLSLLPIPEALGGAGMIRSLWGTRPDDLFAAGEDGALYHWDGVEWLPWGTGTAQDLNEVSGNYGDVYIVGNGGVVLKIRNRRSHACHFQTIETATSEVTTGRK